MTCTNLKDLLNQRFGRLVVLERSLPNGHDGARWLCVCDCGNRKVLTGRGLRRGYTRSCGCYGTESRTLPRVVVRNASLPEYGVWKNMKSRCVNPNNPDFKNYGGRGIVVCPEWFNSFKKFYIDMGKRPTKTHSIDRIKVNGNYEPSNCRWATNEEQARNKRNSVFMNYNGVQMTVVDVAKLTGISYMTLSRCLKREKTDEAAFTSAMESRITILSTINGLTKSVRGWSAVYGLSRQLCRIRLDNGESMEEIIYDVALKEFTINGVTKTRTEWAKLYNLTTMQLYNRMRNVSIEKALTYPNN